MTPQSAKAKGRKLQQWTRDLILKLWSGLTIRDVRSTSMGAGGVDIQLSTRASEVVPYAIECKNHEQIGVYKWYEQATENSENLEPLLVIKSNNKKPLVVVDAEHFFGLVRRSNETTLPHGGQ